MQICCTLIFPLYQKIIKNRSLLKYSWDTLWIRWESHRVQITKPRNHLPAEAEENTVRVVSLLSGPAAGHRLHPAPVAVSYCSKLPALGKGHIVVSITGYYLENLISCPAVGLLSSLLWLATLSLLVTRIARLLEVIKTQKFTDWKGSFRLLELPKELLHKCLWMNRTKATSCPLQGLLRNCIVCGLCHVNPFLVIQLVFS